MIKKFLFAATVFSVALVSISQSRADYIVDFTGAGLHPSVTRTIVVGDFTGTNPAIPGSSLVTSSSNLLWVAEDGGTRTGSVRYDFNNGLNDFLGGLNASKPFSLVRFEVAMDTTIRSGGGQYSITGRYFDTGATTGTVFSTLSNVQSGGQRVVMNTTRTMQQLQTNDIDAVEWTISYSGGGSVGFKNDFQFGNSLGLIAAPEPTSAAMIGCVLVGLVARRRRKA
ncbi:PEP-CTERM sorting domain-containing protein [bacterium]|nr:PEP-CTERM sorting domain-containing protein [Mariniblastus sp.]MDB4483508.1 PEP-CTERM sorting domain-containing protein [bacterium]